MIVHTGTGHGRNGHLSAGRPKKKFELTKLQALHHEILRMKLTGLKNLHIAEYLGISKETVQYTVNSSLGKAKLQLMQAAADSNSIDFQQRIKNMLPHVAEFCEGQLDPAKMPEHPNPDLQLKVAKFVAADLAGVTAPKRVDARHVHAHMTTDDIEALKKRGMQQAAAAGMIAE